MEVETCVGGKNFVKHYDLLLNFFKLNKILLKNMYIFGSQEGANAPAGSTAVKMSYSGEQPLFEKRS